MGLGGLRQQRWTARLVPPDIGCRCGPSATNARCLRHRGVKLSTGPATVPSHERGRPARTTGADDRHRNGAVHESQSAGAELSVVQEAWTEIRRAYGWPRTWFPLALFAAASWGTWGSFSDGAGDRIFGTFPLLAPVVLVSCCVIAQGWGRDIT